MDGWLQESSGRNVLRFHRDHTARYEAYVFIDRGEPIAGQPALLKRRERLSRKRAIEHWQKLLQAGWRRVEAQW
ncbi:DUF1651 domain-containing protein [Synechococcus sp. RedBA-s]|uniref:DUF1651 domain-containing protein n=1 Tax=Synechococcus sp. RedBA-s TaxID=2823741 RepID=UPI0020CC47E7|nr:DUF1651 domain-containing protein [Synechococcus sp. RedBA-s]MCP9799906.1 DUF1651 domain-containing protein [Synechococcus sp. RedBA-s]